MKLATVVTRAAMVCHGDWLAHTMATGPKLTARGRRPPIHNDRGDGRKRT